MSSNGAGSQRIVVTGVEGEPRTPAAVPAVAPVPRDARPPRGPLTKKPAMQHGWTTRRLAIACGLGAAATLLGGLVFLWGFGVIGDANRSPLVAMGFGLFVIGMVVFCGALIALLGTGISVIADNSGWALAAAVVGGPLALAWAIYGVGVVGYAVPAVLSLMLIGGLVAALK